MFAEVTKDKNLHGEHVSLSFEASSRRFFFKIDYYDLNWRAVRKIRPIHKTKRVGTLMLAAEGALGLSSSSNRCRYSRTDSLANISASVS
jgi:hypothetical protein